MKAAEGNYTIPVEIIEQSQLARQEIDRIIQEIEEMEIQTGDDENQT